MCQTRNSDTHLYDHITDILSSCHDDLVFIEYPKQLGIPPISDLEAKVIASRNRSFLEEKFLSSGALFKVNAVVSNA